MIWLMFTKIIQWWCEKMGKWGWETCSSPSARWQWPGPHSGSEMERKEQSGSSLEMELQDLPEGLMDGMCGKGEKEKWQGKFFGFSPEQPDEWWCHWLRWQWLKEKQVLGGTVRSVWPCWIWNVYEPFTEHIRKADEQTWHLGDLLI